MLLALARSSRTPTDFAMGYLQCVPKCVHILPRFLSHNTLTLLGLPLPGASDFLASSLSSGMLALLVLITSVSIAAAAIAYMVQAYAIPGSLVTEGWRDTRATAI